MSAAENVVAFPGAPEKVSFVQVPTAVMDALFAAGLSGAEFKLAYAIARQTYGYNKLADDVTITRLSAIAGVPRQRGSVAFGVLLARRIVSATKGRHGYVVGLNVPSFWLGVDAAASQNVTDVAECGTADGVTTVTKRDGQPSQNVTVNIQPQYTTTNITPPYSPPHGADAGASGDVAGDGGLSPAVCSKARVRGRGKLTLAAWLERCKAAGEKPLPPDDPVFADAGELGLELDWLRLAWLDFKGRYTGANHSRKRYADWRQVFRTAVRECWCKFWVLPQDGTPATLTSVGRARLLLAQKGGEL